MKGREFKDAVFEHFARIAYAFAAPKRLELIDLLAQGERDVDSLAREGAMSVANASRHLQVLKGAKLVKSRREGVRIIYQLSDRDVFTCWKNLQSIAENRVSEIHEISRMFLEERNALESITSEELWQKIKTREVTVVDVRPKQEFERSHLPGAISLPLSEVEARLEKLPKELEVVAYCRGPYCVLSPEAILKLKKAGFQARRLDDGLPEWIQAGLPVE